MAAIADPNSPPQLLPDGPGLRLLDPARDRSRTQFRTSKAQPDEVPVSGYGIHPQIVGDHALSQPSLVHQYTPGLRAAGLLTPWLLY